MTFSLKEEAMKSKVHDLLDQLDSFKGWLFSNKDSAVGFAQKENACPINEWLFDLTGWNVAIDPKQYRLCGEEHDLPAWAKSFVEAIDGEYEESDEIYGEMALEVLSWSSPTSSIGSSETTQGAR